MKFTVKARFLGAVEQEFRDRQDPNSPMQRMMKCQFFIDGESYDIYVTPKEPMYSSLPNMSFGTEVFLSLQLAERQGGGYKLRFAGLDLV